MPDFARKIEGGGIVYTDAHYVDPAASFNVINSHAAPTAPRESRRILNTDGDPAAVQEIREAIAANDGRISFGEYMDIALYGRGGFYSQAKVNFQGNNGEFTTTPQESADFSVSISVGVCAMINAFGKEQINLLELGAGTGRMMKDVLAAMRNEDPEAYSLVNAYIADYGGMTVRQKKSIGSNEQAHIGSYAAMSTPEEHAQDLSKVSWIPGSALGVELDNDRPTIVISNEVPDAVRTEVVRNNQGVLEQKYVELNEKNELVEQWGVLTDEVRDYTTTYGTVIELGKEVSISPDVVALQRQICRLIRRGGWINIDYGSDGPDSHPSAPWTPRPVKMVYDRPTGEWYETGAVRTYPPNFHPLQMPGELDITHNPDFTVLRTVAHAEGMTEEYYGTQRGLLNILGLPLLSDFEYIIDYEGLSDASLARIESARSMPNGGFKALVLTKGVNVDFQTPRQPLAQFRPFFNSRIMNRLSA